MNDQYYGHESKHHSKTIRLPKLTNRACFKITDTALLCSYVIDSLFSITEPTLAPITPPQSPRSNQHSNQTSESNKIPPLPEFIVSISIFTRCPTCVPSLPLGPLPTTHNSHTRSISPLLAIEEVLDRSFSCGTIQTGHVINLPPHPSFLALLSITIGIL